MSENLGPVLQFDFIERSPVLSPFKKIHEELMNIVIASGESNEGDIVFPHHSITKLDKWLNQKKLTKQQAISSLVKKQENLVELTRESIQGLEIGFNAGQSAAIMLENNSAMSLTVVDIGTHKYTRPCYRYLKRLYGDRINLVIGDSKRVVPTLEGKFDFIHIDGSHKIADAKKDIENSHSLLEDNGILLFDDTQSKPLDRLVTKFCHDKGYTKIDLQIVNPCQHKAFRK